GEVMQVENEAQKARIQTLPRLLTSFGNALLNAAKALQAQLAPEATTTVSQAQPIATSFTA
ncbi:MAG: hypothetical protein O2962_09190, partial [Cyanobacteria bacterium]|nr:hypothetical protein [Cyanobacteriota bacterium]